MALHDLLPILQVSIGPVILVSGIGLVLLSMTNRFARILDRSRDLADTIKKSHASERAVVQAQIDILTKRARITRRAITMATFSILLAALLIITLFFAAMFRWEVGGLVAVIFVVCMGSLILSLIDFLRDINLSLGALSLELESPHP